MTIDDVVDTVQEDYLKRDDITALVTKQAVRVYRTICGKIPFEELQTTAPAIPTVIGGTEYDLSTLDPPLAGICSIKINYTSTRAKRLKKSDVRNYDAIATKPNGEPVQYARWAKKIIVDPPPNLTSYNMVIRYWSAAKIEDIAATTELVIPDEWVELIEWETYYRTLVVLKQSMDAAMLVQPGMIPRQGAPKKVFMNDIGIIPRLWNDLLQTIRMREYVDDDYGMIPMTGASGAGR